MKSNQKKDLNNPQIRRIHFYKEINKYLSDLKPYVDGISRVRLESSEMDGRIGGIVGVIKEMITNGPEGFNPSDVINSDNTTQYALLNAYWPHQIHKAYDGNKEGREKHILAVKGILEKLGIDGKDLDDKLRLIKSVIDPSKPIDKPGIVY